ncbi:MAG: hypothetical protein RIR59_31 [Pseudomonadota bacterium]
MALVGLAIAAILSWAWQAGPLRAAFDGVQQAPAGAALSAAKAPLVEPLILRDVTPETARDINARTPFTTDPIPAAQPFHITGSAFDRDRATDCLAAAIWYEAGAESLAGQKAVAQVVLNRVRHPAFPKSVCGVVFQGAERATGCQFTFTCDGAMARTPSAAAWANARGLARIMLTGEVFRPVGTATHYHTNWVLPAWSAKLDKVHQEATHLFFRWEGWWGTPGAFRGRYAGTEPGIAQLARLSPVHATTAGAIDLAAQEAALLGLTGEDRPESVPDGKVPANPYGFKPVLQSAVADMLIFVVPKSTDTGMLMSLALFSCSVRPYCKVMVWTDARKAPSSLPVADDYLASMAFSYLRNRAAGVDKALWNCDLFPRAEANQCMKRRTVAQSPGAAPTAPMAPAKAPLRGSAADGAETAH